MTTLRIFFTTDLHGSDKCFMKFVNAGAFYQADAIIVGGDITGKAIVPIVETSKGFFEAKLFGSVKTARTSEETSELEKSLRTMGYYPYVTSQNELEELTRNELKKDQLFTRLMIEQVDRWIKIADERLKKTGIRCVMMPGNDDRLDIDQVFSRSDFVVNPEGKVLNLDKDHEMISSGYANITPWKCPRDMPEEKLGEKIEGMVSQVKNMERCIFNFHCPPYDSGLDSAPKLDDKFQPVMSSMGMVMVPAGSTEIRKAIEKFQPMLGLHGHIHESRGIASIGRTLCINPGSEYTEGVLRGAIIVIEEKKVKNYLLTSG